MQRQAGQGPGGGATRAIRARILDVAAAVFVERGYAAATTLEIATRAQVSKRELYALVGDKQAMLVACITERAARMQLPADLAVLRDRETLARELARFGERVLHEATEPAVIGAFRLAIAEAERAPEIARTLDGIGREASRVAVTEMLTRARSAGLVRGPPAEMTGQFLALLWGNLMVGLLLRVADRPSEREMARQARSATAAFLKLYPEPPRTDGTAQA